MKSLNVKRYLFVVLAFFLVGCGTLPKRPADTAVPIHYAETPLTDSWNFYGCTIRYHTSGTGQPMIFLHNGGTDHRIWDYQIEHYAKSHTVYALDLPGFGESDQADDAYTVFFYTEMLAQFITYKKLKNVTLVGNCMGSSMALYYAILNPDKVTRLILFNILSENTLHKGTYGFWQSMSNVPGGKGCLSFFSPVVWMPNFYIKGQLTKLYGSKGLAGEPDPDFLEHLRTLFKKSAQLPSLTNVLVHIKSFGILDNPKDLPKLPPTCVFWGEQNKVLPVSAGQVLCDKYNFNKFIVVQDTGHLLMREKYKNINAMIDNFMIETDL